ncbi:MAG TPA: hypothetical protein VKI18_00400 [Albitalea sp.]|nr:hypothetical protein [Albitalea sp.]
MQSTAQTTSSTAGSLVADHCHTFTSQRFYYLASYRSEGSKILWQASVRLGSELVEELCGVTVVGPHSGVIPAVKNAVEAAIDRHAFFESAWGGLSGLSALPRPAGGHHQPGPVHG